MMLAKALISSTLFAACGGSDPDPTPPAGCTVHDTPTFELGTGDVSFSPLTDGQDLMMSTGTQGGCHFWLAVRTDGFAERRLNIRYEVFYADTGASTGSASNLNVRLKARADVVGQCEYVRYFGYLIKPWEFEDARVRIDVRLTDDLGRSSMQSTTVVARWPADVAGTPRDDLCGPRI